MGRNNRQWDYKWYLSFINDVTGWAVGSDVLKTTNGGYNWFGQKINSAFTGDGIGVSFHSSYFLDEYTGWIVGQRGLILKTTNGGDNFK